MATPKLVNFDRYAELSWGFISINAGAGAVPNGVGLVTEFVSNGLWEVCLDIDDQHTTVWEEYPPLPLPSVTWTACEDFPVTAVQTITASAPLASGSYVLNFNGESTDPIPWNTTGARVADYLHELTGLWGVQVAGDFTSLAASINVYFYEYRGAAPLLTISSNTTGKTFTVVTVVEGDDTVWTEC